MQVHKLLNLYEFREKYNIPEAKFGDYRVAYDGKIYLIMVTKEEYTIKDRVNGWRTGYKRTNHYFRISFDWNKGKVLEIEQFDLGYDKTSVHYWCPLKENFLLLCARTDSRKKSPNAHIVDKDGNLIREFCMGDGIEECYTTPSGKIIAGYMDERIFDSWNQGGKCGITMWDENGKRIWCNRRYDIWHCYSLNLDPQKCLWFYYYGHCDDDKENVFHLVYSKKEKNVVFTLDIKGSYGFAVSRNHKKLWLGGGYEDKNSVYVYDMDCEAQTLSNRKKVHFELEGNEIEFCWYRFSEDKVFLCMEDGTLVVGRCK